ncbi:MAG: hypothetical protein IPM46_03110 [Flavobacteriales bacterium]|nr:hypothetical protein [Flavobacteriales bacterium]
MTPIAPLKTLALLLLFLANIGSVAAQTTIGAWRDHFPYLRMVDVVEGGGKAYCATSSGLFRYDPQTGEFDRINKTNLLNDVDVRGLAWNEPLQMLLVHYGNGNLDLVQGDQSFNMGDIKRSTLLGNKAIYRVHFEGTTAYLACGFGIVVVDLQRREVKETWFIGPNGGQVQVNAITFSADSIYAATSTGLFTASRAEPNLAAFTNWRKRTDMGDAMAAGPFDVAVTFQGRPMINYRKASDNQDTALVLRDDNTWERFSGVFGRRNRDMRVAANGEFIVFAHDYDVQVFGSALQFISQTYSYSGIPVNPARAIRSIGGYLWVADREAGLARAEGGDVGTTVRPNGPLNTGVYRMDAKGGALYVASGAPSGNWGNAFSKEGVHHFVDGEWRSSSPFNNSLLSGGNDFGGAVNDFLTVAVDPRDPGHAYAGSWDDGLIEFRDRQPVAIYNDANSSLGLVTNDGSGKTNVAGLCYDANGNLWMTNAWAARPVSVLTRGGVWQSFTPGSLLNGNLLLAEILAASNGLKWIIRPRGNALLVLNDNGTITDTSDDQWKLVNNTPGSGGLPAPDVLSVAEDQQGQVWVGTSKGIAVFYNPSDLFTASPSDAQQILIEQDGNVQILLETEFISAIVVDGANRKWIGTQTGGAFLLSADGREQLIHFTETNSPLPSNTINSIAIDGITGEVFFGTDRGIIGYRSDAVDGADDATCASVFPNPVRETHFGPVAITGLASDSEVKITDVSGNLVYRTTSLGGQAIWNANDMSGNRVATGVYLIFASDREGLYKCNTKVLVVR